MSPDVFFPAQENISTLQEPFDMEELMGVTQQLEENVTSTAAIEEENINISNADFIEYDKCVQKIINEQEEIISLQDEIVSTGGNLGGLLSLSERNSIKTEVDEAKKLFNLHIRDDNSSKDLRHVFDPLLFQRLVTGIKTACPTITNILEQLVLSSSTSRNTIKTESMKMKAAVHLLASLLDIRDQYSKNDIPMLFGLLCICYGAGPAVIRVLQRLGLTE